MKNDQEDDDKSKLLRQVGAYLTIPFVLAVSPVIGWLLGSWLDKHWNTSPYFMYIGIVLGFIAGFRELYRIIKGFEDGN